MKNLRLTTLLTCSILSLAGSVSITEAGAASFRNELISYLENGSNAKLANARQKLSSALESASWIQGAGAKADLEKITGGLHTRWYDRLKPNYNPVSDQEYTTALQALADVYNTRKAEVVNAAFAEKKAYLQNSGGDAIKNQIAQKLNGLASAAKQQELKAKIYMAAFFARNMPRGADGSVMALHLSNLFASTANCIDGIAGGLDGLLTYCHSLEAPQGGNSDVPFSNLGEFLSKAIWGDVEKAIMRAVKPGNARAAQANEDIEYQLLGERLTALMMGKQVAGMRYPAYAGQNPFEGAMIAEIGKVLSRDALVKKTKEAIEFLVAHNGDEAYGHFDAYAQKMYSASTGIGGFYDHNFAIKDAEAERLLLHFGFLTDGLSLDSRQVLEMIKENFAYWRNTLSHKVQQKGAAYLQEQSEAWFLSLTQQLSHDWSQERIGQIFDNMHASFEAIRRNVEDRIAEDEKRENIDANAVYYKGQFDSWKNSIAGTLKPREIEYLQDEGKLWIDNIKQTLHAHYTQEKSQEIYSRMRASFGEMLAKAKARVVQDEKNEYIQLCTDYYSQYHYNWMRGLREYYDPAGKAFLDASYGQWSAYYRSYFEADQSQAAVEAMSANMNQYFLSIQGDAQAHVAEANLRKAQANARNIYKNEKTRFLNSDQMKSYQNPGLFNMISDHIDVMLEEQVTSGTQLNGTEFGNKINQYLEQWNMQYYGQKNAAYFVIDRKHDIYNHAREYFMDWGAWLTNDAMLSLSTQVLHYINADIANDLRKAELFAGNRAAKLEELRQNVANRAYQIATTLYNTPGNRVIA